MRFRPQWIERQSTEAADDDDEPHDTVVPVHVVKVAKATLRRYVEGFGVVEPTPARAGRMAGTADIASPMAGVVAEVLCEAGQKVTRGTPLLQLDDRLAKAAEQQSAAALASAKASLAKLKTTPRPEQLEITRLAVEKARAGVEFATKAYDRQLELAKGQGTTQKNIESAVQDLNSARIDLAVAEKQYVLLKASPTPEELADETAKVAQAEAALAAARTQREMLRILSPLDATVVSVTVHPGESVDTTRVLVDLVAPDRLVVTAGIAADDLRSLAVGMPVEVLPAGPAAGKTHEAPVEGKTWFISPEVDRKTNTAPVGIDVPAGFSGRPGQAVRVRILAEEHKDVLAVPRECLIQDANGDDVVAVVEGNQATHKRVKVGLREDNLAEISADGLKEGDAIVGGGSHGIPEATKVKIIEQ
jgi:multidrug efflux pump subunit AcrA (membrane-fusion protein)